MVIKERQVQNKWKADVFTEERGVSAVITPGRAVMSRVVLGISSWLGAVF